jgi:hypothetical protein
MKRSARIVSLLSAVALFASGLAHAFLGWGQFASALEASAVPDAVVGALAVGWYFGSTAMIAFAAIALAAALRRRASASLLLGIIGGTYVLFGLAAYLSRDFNPHFLGFVGIGVLAATAAVLSRES